MKRNKMKKNEFSEIILLMIIGLLATGCSKDESSSEGEEYITISSQIMHSPGRISGSHFDAGDKIGVFVVPYQDSSNTIPGDISQSDYAVNIEHTYSGVSWISSSGRRIPWPTEDRHVAIYSYYPYMNGFGEENALSTPFTVQNDQRTKESYDSSDFLWTKTTSVAQTKDPVELIFSHQLSKIRISIKSDIDISKEDFETATVSLLNVDMTTDINLSNGVVGISPSSEAAEIITYHYTTPATNYELSSEAILIPQTIQQGVPFIRIQLGVSNIRYHYTPTTEIPFESGKERTFNITITHSGISVTVGSITDWQPSDVIDGEIGKPMPKILDLSEIDWSYSLIHNIYDKGALIGAVSKEYIFKTGVVDFPAIVVYAINSEGEISYSDGFVAQVLNRDRNSSTNEYEPNTGSIHGGTVSWETSNTLGSYSAGTQALINKIEIATTGISSASDYAINTLTSAPYLLTDIDGNNYSIVKISSQFWMAENLKTEHYRDGSSLTYYYYNDDLSNKETFGGLYTWATAVDEKGLCPENWHVPVNNDFITVYQYLTPNAGRKLKANILWNNLNFNDNVTGFSGLPAGRRTSGGVYNEMYYYSQWWSSTSTSTSDAYRLYLDFSNNAMQNTTLGKTYTQSIRCLRDF